MAEEHLTERVGYKLVPLVPTPQMVQAMEARQYEGSAPLPEDSISYALWVEVYKAMLDAVDENLASDQEHLVLAVATMRANAKRYEWLRDHANVQFDHWETVQLVLTELDTCEADWLEKIDASIDALMVDKTST